MWLSWLDQSLQVDEPMLRQAFNRLFLSLPSFVERYPDIVDVVRSLYFPPKGEGMFAFVEFVDDVLTTTAMQMSGFELQNRSIRIGRPQSYEPPHDGELAGLDVQPLREKGCCLRRLPEKGKRPRKGSRMSFVKCTSETWPLGWWTRRHAMRDEVFSQPL